ncbi:MAG: hypothetical protein KC449_18210 [Anaerolineales bacterium]|nr:hypothetical protein [Anaerolineales bacterium]
MTEHDTTNGEESNHQHFQLTYSLDDDRFLRRECSHCGLPFKTVVKEADLSHLLAPTFKQIEEKYDIALGTATEEEEPPLLDQLGCPYCAHVASPQDMLDSEFSNYVLRLLEREIVFPHLRDFQEQLAATFGRRTRSRNRGLISLEFSFQADPIVLPVRPISGPALSDMLMVNLLCCKQNIKILEGWMETIYCPFCQEQLVLT